MTYSRNFTLSPHLMAGKQGREKTIVLVSPSPDGRGLGRGAKLRRQEANRVTFFCTYALTLTLSQRRGNHTSKRSEVEELNETSRFHDWRRGSRRRRGLFARSEKQSSDNADPRPRQTSGHFVSQRKQV